MTDAIADSHKGDRPRLPEAREDASDATTDVPHRSRIPQMKDGLEKDVKDYLQNLTAEMLEIKGAIGELNTTIAVHGARFETVCKKVEQHDLDINGDGKPGIKAELVEFQHTLKGHGKLLWGAVMTVVSCAVAAWLDLLVW